MPSTYSSNLRLELIASGEQANTWGNTTNTNLGTLLESAIAGRVELNSGWAANSITLTAFNGANDQSRQMCLVVPAITISANSTIVVPASAVTSSSGKMYTVINKSTSYTVTIKLPATTGVTIPANTAKTVVYNGTDFQEAFTALDLLTLTGTPTTSAHAVNKGYVDGKFFSIADNNTVSGNTTFTGTVTLSSATPTGNQATSYNYVNTNYLWKAAGVTSQTMNPYLRLNYTPTDPADAVHKSYVDSNFVGVTNVQTISGAKTFSASVALTGPSTSLTLANAPTADMQASTKKYVDDTVNTALSAASGLYALKTTTLYAGTGIELNGTSFAALDDDITITLVGGGTVTSVSASAPLDVTGTSAVNISIPPATNLASGYLLNTDWSIFKGKCDANGSNATGNAWNISILGNAGTASSVAWTGVSGRPTAVSAFTNDAGYLSSVSWTQVSDRPTNVSQFNNDSGYATASYVNNATVNNANNLGGVLASGYLRTNGSNGIVASSTNAYLDVRSSTFASPVSGIQSTRIGTYYDGGLGYNVAYVASRSETGTAPNGGPILAFYRVTGSTYTVSATFGAGGAFTVNQLSGSGNRDVEVDSNGKFQIKVSDQNLKIADGLVEEALPIVDQLEPRYFYWKDENGEIDTVNGRKLGFFAQEVHALIPEVSTTGTTIDDRALIAMLVKAVQELSAEVKALKGA